MNVCRCGCGQSVNGKRVFVDKVHQLEWMVKGGAKAIDALEPMKARVKGGEVAGQQAKNSGRLVAAAQKGGARSREIADTFRATREVSADPTNA